MDKKDILERVVHDSGMTVPDGYFEDFASRMVAELPPQPWEKTGSETDADHVGDNPSRNIWQRIRPYVYMAAMFAGIWLMMNIFNIAAPESPAHRIESNPVLSQAIDSEQFVDEITETSSICDTEEMDEMLDEMYSDGVTVESLRAALLKSNDKS